MVHHHNIFQNFSPTLAQLELEQLQQFGVPQGLAVPCPRMGVGEGVGEVCGVLIHRLHLQLVVLNVVHRIQMDHIQCPPVRIICLFALVIILLLMGILNGLFSLLDEHLLLLLLKEELVLLLHLLLLQFAELALLLVIKLLELLQVQLLDLHRGWGFEHVLGVLMELLLVLLVLELVLLHHHDVLAIQLLELLLVGVIGEILLLMRIKVLLRVLLICLVLLGVITGVSPWLVMWLHGTGTGDGGGGAGGVTGCTWSRDFGHWSKSRVLGLVRVHPR